MSPFPDGMSQYIYNSMRAALGSPAASLVRPMSEWALTNAYYDADHDVFRLSANDAVVEPSTLWNTRSLNILPSTHTKETDALIAVGELSEDSVDLFVYGKTDIAAVSACYGIILGSKLYRVAETVPTPNDDPQWALVRLSTL